MALGWGRVIVVSAIVKGLVSRLLVQDLESQLIKLRRLLTDAIDVTERRVRAVIASRKQLIDCSSHEKQSAKAGRSPESGVAVSLN